MQDFPGGSAVKNPPANAGDSGLIPGTGRSPGEGNGNPLQCPCLKNPMTEKPGSLFPKSCNESDVTEQLNTCAHTHIKIVDIVLKIQCEQRKLKVNTRFNAMC